MTAAIGTGHPLTLAENSPAATLESLLDLSASLFENAQESGMASDDMIAAAESLEKVSRRMRELAGTRHAPGPGATAAPCPRVIPEDSAQGARILLADDLDLNRKLIADMLSLDGYDVDCVADGAAAVRAVETQRYDLVLMDMVMPVMDGLAATRAIRALRGPAREVPIVALTANAFREQLTSCIEAGMNAAVSKPMTMDALTAVVTQWTRGRHAAA